MSRSGDFCGGNDNDGNRQTDKQTDYFTPAHAHSVNIAHLCMSVQAEQLGK